MEKFGFLFNYSCSRIGKSQPLGEDDLSSFDPQKHNNDDVPLFVRCKNCGVLMDFTPGPNDDLNGKWICPECKTKVRERTAYSELGRENDAFLSDLFDVDEEY